MITDEGPLGTGGASLGDPAECADRVRPGRGWVGEESRGHFHQVADSEVRRVGQIRGVTSEVLVLPDLRGCHPLDFQKQRIEY